MNLKTTPLMRQAGHALVELAIALFAAVVIFMGVFDIASIAASRKLISSLSRDAGTLPPLQDLREVTNQQIMDVVARNAGTLNLHERGMIYITVVQKASGGFQILAQEGWQGSRLNAYVNSRLGTPTLSQPHPNALNLDHLDLSAGDVARVVEIFYNHHSTFLSYSPQLYSAGVLEDKGSSFETAMTAGAAKVCASFSPPPTRQQYP